MLNKSKAILSLLVSFIILPSLAFARGEDIFVGTWQGKLSGECVSTLVRCWETGFEMDILNLKVAERRRIPGRGTFSRAVSGWATVHYNTPKYIPMDPDCSGEVKMESGSISGQIEGEINTLQWEIPGGETAWCLNISNESQKRLAPEGTWTVTCKVGRRTNVISGAFVSGEILSFVNAPLNSRHKLDFTINRNDNSIALHEERAPLPFPFFPFTIPNGLTTEYKIDGILYGVHHEPFDFNNLPPNGLVETDKHTRKEIIIPNVGEVIVNTNSECKFKTDKLLEQFKGKLFFKVRKLEPQQFEIRTPVSIVGMRGTQFVTNVDKDRTTTLTVLEGSVEFSDLNKKKTVVVKKNQTSVVKPGGLPSEPVSIDEKRIPIWWE